MQRLQTNVETATHALEAEGMAFQEASTSLKLAGLIGTKRFHADPRCVPKAFNDNLFKNALVVLATCSTWPSPASSTWLADSGHHVHSRLFFFRPPRSVSTAMIEP